MKCTSKKGEQAKSNEDFPYSLDVPTTRYELKEELREISGLSYLSKNKLACIQDEKGVLFIFDYSKMEVISEFKFGKKGDYEGVEVVDDTVFLIKSDGEITSFPIGGNQEDISVISTPLNSQNDVEGLGYDKKKNSLLIVCKEKGSISNDDIKGKAIYSFSLKNKELDETPYFIISNDIIKDFSEKQKFKPSAIAMHPLTGEIYILSSPDKMLVVIKEKEVKSFIALDSDLYEQPEGICFSPDGTLFISSEGKTGNGYILRFNYNSTGH